MAKWVSKVWLRRLKMILFYDKEGKPITSDQMKRLRSDKDYLKIAETTLPDGKWVSTVWLGIDHNFEASGPSLIFETMVFSGKIKYDDLDCDRYSTEAEALEGHQRMVQKWSES